MFENIKINPEFQRLIPPLTDDEFEVLKKDILSAGEIYTPIFVCNGYIIDGHHRFKILSEYSYIRFRIIEKEFENTDEVVSWICNNQLGRRNLTPENRKYLIGKRYGVEKKTHGASDRFRGNQYKHIESSENESSSHITRKRIAQETGTSEGYVRRAHEFARGIDKAEKVLPGIKKEILSGSKKITAKDISTISKAISKESEILAEILR